MLMTVYPFHQYRHTIDTETTVLYFRSTETDFRPGHLSHFSISVFQFQYQCIQVRMFCTPFFNIRNTFLIKSNQIAQTTGFNRLTTIQYRLSGLILQFIGNGSYSGCRSFYSHIKFENAVFISILFKDRGHFIIGNILLGSTVEIHIPLNTA